MYSHGPSPPPELIREWTVITNFDHPSEQRGWGIVIINAVFLTVALVVVALRLYARLIIKKTAGVDDLFISLGLVLAAAYIVITSIGSRHYGFDRHIWDVPTPMAIKARQMMLVVKVLVLWATACTKISILLFYRRMTGGPRSSMFMFFVKLSMASIALGTFAFTFVYIRTCTPLDAYWLKVDPKWVEAHDFRCFDEGIPTLVWMIISACQDVLACGLPFLLLRKVQLPKREKLALYGIFGIGFSVCGTAIARIYYAYYMHWKTWDVTWYSYHAFMWCTVEMFLGIIAASAPALKCYFQHWLQAPLPDRTARTSRPGYTPTQSGWRELKGNASVTVSSMGSVDEIELEKPNARVAAVIAPDEEIFALEWLGIRKAAVRRQT